MHHFFTLFLLVLNVGLLAQTPDTIVQSPVFESVEIDEPLPGSIRPRRQFTPLQRSESKFKPPYSTFEQDGWKGLRDATGKIIFPARFTSVAKVWGYYPAGKSVYLIRFPSGKANIVDVDMNFLVEDNFDEGLLTQTGNALLIDLDAEISKLMDQNGELISQPNLDHYGRLVQHKGQYPNQDSILVLGIDNLQGLVKSSGEIIFPLKRQTLHLTDSIIIVVPQGTAPGPTLFLDYDLNEVHATSSREFVRVNNGTIQLRGKKDDLYYFLNRKGEQIAGPYQIRDYNKKYQVLSDQSTGLMGLLDASGKVVANPSFDHISVSNIREADFALVRDTLGRTGIYHPPTNSYPLPCTYRELKHYGTIRNDDGDTYIFREDRDGKTQFYTGQGTPLLPSPVAGAIGNPLSSSLVMIRQRKGGKWVAFDLASRKLLSSKGFVAVSPTSFHANKTKRQQRLDKLGKGDSAYYGYDEDYHYWAVKQSGEIISDTTTSGNTNTKQQDPVFESLGRYIEREKVKSEQAASQPFTPESGPLKLVKDTEGWQKKRVALYTAIVNADGQTIIPPRYSSVDLLLPAGSPTDTAYFHVRSKDGQNVINSRLSPSFPKNRKSIHNIGNERLVSTSWDCQESRVTTYDGQSVSFPRDSFAARRLIASHPAYLPEQYERVILPNSEFGIIDEQGKFIIPVARQSPKVYPGKILRLNRRLVPGCNDVLFDSALAVIWQGEETIIDVFPNAVLTFQSKLQRLSLLNWAGDTLWTQPEVTYYPLKVDLGYLSSRGGDRSHFSYQSTGKTSRIGLVDLQGKEILTELDNIEALEVPDRYIVTNATGKQAIITNTGKIILDYDYHKLSIQRFKDWNEQKYFIVSQQPEHEQIYDLDGNPLLNKPADRLLLFEYANPFFGVVRGQDYFIHDLNTGKAINEKAFRFITREGSYVFFGTAAQNAGLSSDRYACTVFDNRGHQYLILKDGTILSRQEALGY